MKKTIIRALLLAIIAMSAGLLYNTWHKPHLPIFALNGEEIQSADNQVINGETQPFNEPLMISLQQARELYMGDEALFIDARVHADFSIEHIAGAVNIPLEEINGLEQYADLFKATYYIIYCDGDECTLSTDLAYLLAENDSSGVLVFHEGLSVWKEAGFPVERGGE